MTTGKKKKISCGILITDGKSHLMCHPTGSYWWNIAKGVMDEGETYEEAAVRELAEETGIKASTKDIDFIGVFPYKSDKDLALFKMIVKEMPDPRDLVCSSTFKDGARKLPEMDGFQVVSRETFLEKVNPALRKILQNVI